MKSFFKRQATNIQRFLGTYDLVKVQSIQQVTEYNRLKNEMLLQYPDTIALFGYKVYSQTDEDGIIEEIFKRIPNTKRFLEIGIQSGVECNTLFLLLNEWKGTWVEGSTKHFKKIVQDLNGSSFKNKLSVVNSFVDSDNICSIFNESNNYFGSTEIDFFSLDIDGNDYYIIEQLFKNSFFPKVICVEYNAKFKPPLQFKIKYNKLQVWNGSDYLICSLQSYVNLFAKYKYTLVACNIPGINAFFVRDEYAPLFKTYSIEQLYQPYRFYLSPITPPHKPSLSYLKDILEEGS